MEHKAYSAGFFETKIKYEKMTDDGKMKKVSESYVVDALSFTEAEKRITEEMSSYVSGEYQVVAEKITNYGVVITCDDYTHNLWYKVRVQFEVLDEKTSKVKKDYSYYLVQGGTVSEAKKAISWYLDKTMMDWKIYSVSETNIIDVFFYKTKSNNESEADSQS